MNIPFKKFSKDIELPAYATIGSAGFDLVADNFKVYKQSGLPSLNEERLKEAIQYGKLVLPPKARAIIGVGFGLAIPEGYMMDIRPRSGNAIKLGLGILNSPGTIDSDYRDEIGVIVVNHSTDVIIIEKGDKIAQGLIIEYNVAVFQEVDELPDPNSNRRGGFGSTDVKTKLEREAGDGHDEFS